MDKRTFCGGTAAAFLTVPLFLLPAEAIPRFGEWLREQNPANSWIKVDPERNQEGTL